MANGKGVNGALGGRCRFAEITSDHPVWSNRPYKVFLKSPVDAHRVVGYVEDNPAKEQLAPQSWAFITRYDGWPGR